MNVAFPAFIIFLLLLPGFIFRSRLRRAERTSLDYAPFGEVVTEAILWAVVLHLLWIAATYFIFSRLVEPLVLLQFIVAEPHGQVLALGAASESFTSISTYFVTLLLAAYLVPSGIRYAITEFGLDRRSSPLSRFFRFHHAPWYYLLTGVDVDQFEKIDMVSISVIVNVAGAATI